jgi:titin
MSSISSGDIRISWSSPSDIGGNPILGYKLYVNSTLVLDASTQSTLNTYTFTGLSVGRTYNISVTAVNEISESQASYFYIVAASVP